MGRVWKNSYFLIGFLFILGLLTFSFYHHWILHDKIPGDMVRYDESGTVPIGRAPFGPSKESWFGTDQFGLDLFYMLISGAKYTLSIAFLVAVGRLFFSFVLGLILSFFNAATSRIFSGLSQAFYYLPVALVVFFLQFPITESTIYSFWEKVVFQMVIMILVAIPSTAILLKEEINLIKREEYVSNARILGGSYFHIFKKHIVPQLRGKLLLIFIQQTIAVLTLLAHLGILTVFLGGTLEKVYVFDLTNPEKIKTSLSFEWSGLIGGYFRQLPTAPWLVVFPVIFFGLSILAMNFMMEGLKRSFDQKERRSMKTAKSEAESLEEQIEEKVGTYSFEKVSKAG